MATDQGESLGHWLQSRRDDWQRVEQLLNEQVGRRDDQAEAVIELLDRTRALGKDVSLARVAIPDSPVRGYLEALYQRAFEATHRTAGNWRADLKRLYRDEVPAVVAAMRGTILASFALFILSGLGGWWLVHTYPDLASLFASPRMIDAVQSGILWTDDLLNVAPSSILSVSIMTNNIVVALMAFVLGVFYGLGTLYILTLNGFMLGGVFAFTARHDLAGRLFEFVIAHGVVELSVICLAAAAGVGLGEALIRPGDRSRVAAFQDAVYRAARLLAVVVPALVGAGIIEGHVSPDPDFSLPLRVAVGVGYGVLLWLVLSGRIWRLGKPPPQTVGQQASNP